jgi:hypothetical protein
VPKVHIWHSHLKLTMRCAVCPIPRNSAFISAQQLSSGLLHVSFSAPKQRSDPLATKWPDPYGGVVADLLLVHHVLPPALGLGGDALVESDGDLAVDVVDVRDELVKLVDLAVITLIKRSHPSVMPGLLISVVSRLSLFMSCLFRIVPKYKCI